MFEQMGSYAFLFLDDVSNPPIQLRSTGIEERESETYYYDNAEREFLYIFQYTLSGSGFYWDGTELHEVTPGKAFFAKSPGPSAYYYKNNGTPWKFAFATFRGSYMEEYYQKIVSEHSEVFSLPQTCATIRTLNRICNLAAQQEISNPFIASSLAVDLIMNLCTENSRTDYPPIVRHALQIIESEFASINGVEEIAIRLQVSLSHLCREFSRHTGTTPIVYLTKTRLRYSANQLINTSQKIDDIALASGFSNGNYFAKVFKKNIGCSPKEFRNSSETGWNNIIL